MARGEEIEGEEGGKEKTIDVWGEEESSREGERERRGEGMDTVGGDEKDWRVRERDLRDWGREDYRVKG